MAKKLSLLLFFLALLLFFKGIEGLGLVKKIIDGKSYRQTSDTFIVTVWPNSPSEKSGLEYGDKIISINEMPVGEFYHQVDEFSIDELSLTVERDGQIQNVEFEPGDYSHEAGGSIGVTVSNQFLVSANFIQIVSDHLVHVLVPPKNNGPQFGQLFVKYMSGKIYIMASFLLLAVGTFIKKREIRK